MKLSYTKKLYYKAIAKLLVVPVVLIIPSAWMVWHFGSMILASATMIYGGTLFTVGFFFYPTLKKLDALFSAKVDPVYSKHIEAPLMKERDSAKRGIVGEKVVFNWLTEILPPNQFTILPNLVLPGHRADVDFVVVGPSGVFVFEVKNFTEKLFFTTEDYAYISKNGELIKLDSMDDPRNQLRWNAQRLEEFLKKNGFDLMKTKRALVFPEAGSMIYLGSPSIYLIDTKESMRKFIFSNPNDPRFTPEFCDQIRKSLVSK